MSAFYSTLLHDLERAWKWRENLGLFRETQALRVFHGPGEAASGSPVFRGIMLDRFADHYWVSFRSQDKFEDSLPPAIVPALLDFLRSKNAQSCVCVERVKGGAVPQKLRVLLGEPGLDPYQVSENGMRFWIRSMNSFHPGLFLDHAPLRDWLRRRSQGWRVLNTFAYTGSLSVACGIGGAAQVVTVDLSKQTLIWAQSNWMLNGLPEAAASFMAADAMEWFLRAKKKREEFDCVILDPPSFSRGKSGIFSTAKDLEALHLRAMPLVALGGVLITSINSANVSQAKYASDIFRAAEKLKLQFEVLAEIALPESFPTPLADLAGPKADRYLKGWILRRAV
ncbi:class I SAM-dependent methyltransferase [Bdellovibrionota bacterium FG-2]